MHDCQRSRTQLGELLERRPEVRVRPGGVETLFGLQRRCHTVGLGERRALADMGGQVAGEKSGRGLVEPEPRLAVVRHVRGANTPQPVPADVMHGSGRDGGRIRRPRGGRTRSSAATPAAGEAVFCDVRNPSGHPEDVRCDLVDCPASMCPWCSSMAAQVAECEGRLDWIKGDTKRHVVHFALATTPEGVHWYDRHSVY